MRISGSSRGAGPTSIVPVASGVAGEGGGPKVTHFVELFHPVLANLAERVVVGRIRCALHSGSVDAVQTESGVGRSVVTGLQKLDDSIPAVEALVVVSGVSEAYPVWFNREAVQTDGSIVGMVTNLGSIHNPVSTVGALTLKRGPSRTSPLGIQLAAVRTGY